MILDLFKTFRNWCPLFFFYFFMLELPVTNRVQGMLCECILGSSPIKRLRKIFPWDIPENCHNWLSNRQLPTGCPTGTSSFEIEREMLKHWYLWAAETMVCTVGRPAFSCNSNHQFMFSSKKNEEDQILPLSQGNWKMQSRLKWPSCVAEVDPADVRIPSWGSEDGRNLKNSHVPDIS